MAAPRIYHFHPATGAYLGFGVADQSPLEPGVWLDPANSTRIAPPAPGEGQQAVWGGASWSLVATGSPVNPTPVPLAQAKSEKLAALSSQRYSIETGGMTFAGMSIRTDRETSSILTAAYVTALNDPGYVIANWKLTDGVFIPLDAATIIAVATALRAHVQASFDREAALSALVLAAETHEAVDAIDITAGW